MNPPFFDEAVEAALARLHEVFRDAPVPSVADACGLCWPDGAVSLTLPPAKVPLRDVVSFAQEVEDHFDDYSGLLRRLIPRIAELFAAGELHVDAEFSLARWRRLRADGWPAAEGEAVQAYLEALLRRGLGLPPEHEVNLHSDPADILCAASAVTDDLTPWLDLWAATPGGDSAAHLEELVASARGDDLTDLAEPELAGPWPRGSANVLRRWLQQEWVENAIRRGLDATAQDDSRQPLQQALDDIAYLRAHAPSG